ncbi:uncharacterized protein LOC135368294 [Ornithodoros turicata]|uniref:uncharacterized protein LOC135368294 n=1 Tax=Ornithodoros turicata TaxID=34597 RepID=UPI003139B807
MEDGQPFSNLLCELKALWKEAGFTENEKSFQSAFKSDIPRRTLHHCRSVEDLMNTLLDQELVTAFHLEKLKAIAELLRCEEGTRLIALYEKLRMPEEQGSAEGNGCSSCLVSGPSYPGDRGHGLPSLTIVHQPTKREIEAYAGILYISEYHASYWRCLVRELPPGLQVPERDILALGKQKCVLPKEGQCGNRCTCLRVLLLWRECHTDSATLKVIINAARSSENAKLKEIANVLSSGSYMKYCVNSQCIVIACGMRSCKQYKDVYTVEMLANHLAKEVTG